MSAPAEATEILVPLLPASLVQIFTQSPFVKNERGMYPMFCTLECSRIQGISLPVPFMFVDCVVMQL